MIQIRGMLVSDIEALLAIQSSSPEAAWWSQEAYRAIAGLAGNIRCLVANVKRNESNGAAISRIVAGFACFRVIGPEAELLNLAVLPEFRRRGVGRQLLSAVIRDVIQDGANDLFLEVRASNVAALAFYGQLGWAVSGQRPGYYTNSQEDALILHMRLSHPDAGICDVSLPKGHT